MSFNKFFVSTNENPYFKNVVRMLILKTLYELKDLEMLLNHADTYRHFLRNNKAMKESQKKRALRCIEYTSSLARIKYSFDDFALHKIQKSLHTDANTAEREWLIEKASELGNLPGIILLMTYQERSFCVVSASAILPDIKFSCSFIFIQSRITDHLCEVQKTAACRSIPASG